MFKSFLHSILILIVDPTQCIGLFVWFLIPHTESVRQYQYLPANLENGLPLVLCSLYLDAGHSPSQLLHALSSSQGLAIFQMQLACLSKQAQQMPHYWGSFLFQEQTKI